jgi:protein-disulfide isomerase
MEAKMDRLSRRLVCLLAAAAATLAACQQKTAAAVTADEMSLGNPQAKVTMIEYASVACPFCARFNNTVFGPFKAKYIDTGKVHYVFREMLVGSSSEVSMAAAGFLMARCAGKDKYFPILDQTFHAQDAIYQSGDMRGGLLKIAQANGMSEKQFADCVGDSDSLVAMNARNDKAAADGVRYTPTFFINGKKVSEGGMTLEQLDAAVKAAGG